MMMGLKTFLDTLSVLIALLQGLILAISGVSVYVGSFPDAEPENEIFSPSWVMICCVHGLPILCLITYIYIYHSTGALISQAEHQLH